MCKVAQLLGEADRFLNFFSFKAIDLNLVWIIATSVSFCQLLSFSVLSLGAFAVLRPPTPTRRIVLLCTSHHRDRLFESVYMHYPNINSKLVMSAGAGLNSNLF